MMRRLSVLADCKSGYTCPSVWIDDDDPNTVVVVGHLVDAGTVPLAEGEVAVRVARQVVADAKIA
jgi:hypothetical protein